MLRVHYQDRVIWPLPNPERLRLRAESVYRNPGGEPDPEAGRGVLGEGGRDVGVYGGADGGADVVWGGV